MKLITKSLTTLLLAITTTCAFAQQPCYIVMNKSPSWSTYSVTMYVFNTTSQQLIGTYQLPATTATKPSVNTLKIPLDCAKYPIVNFSARFWPPIWQNLAKQTYASKLFYNTQGLPGVSGSEKYIITVNFPDDFVNVPAQVGDID